MSVNKVIPDFKKMRIGDTTRFILTCRNPANRTAINISTATSTKLILSGPDNTRVEKTGSLYTDGTDGKFEATLGATDVLRMGVWTVQGYVALTGGGVYHTQAFDIEVEAIY